MARPVQDIATGTRALILERAIPLFSRVGFAAVSMREIARAIGITPAALYYHFSDKETLYVEAMRYAYAEQAEAFNMALRMPGSPRQRLQLFVTKLTEYLYAEPEFRRLFQRERLDADEHRMKLLAENLFQEQFEGMSALARELAPEFDPHLWAISIAGLIMYHIETAPLRQFLPGKQKQHDDPAVVADHVVRFILSGTGNPSP